MLLNSLLRGWNSGLRAAFALLILLTVPGQPGADPELPMLGVNAQLNLQKEYVLGKSFFERLQDAGMVIDDPLLDRYINDIGSSLLGLLDVRLRDYRFFLVRDNSVNAFAVPGGFIGVHAGLVATARSEDELAAVLAHEIAHVELRHTMQLIEHAQGVNTVGMLSILAAILLGGQNPDFARALLAAGAAGSGQSIVNFTRSNEYEADRLGIELLNRSGYKPQAMADFMRKLQRKEQVGSVSSIEYLRTHPVGANRIAEIEGRIKPDSPGKAIEKTYRLNRFEQFRDYLYYIYPDAEPSRRQTAFRSALRSIESGDYTAANSALGRLIENDPDNLWYRYSLAESEELAGNLQRANLIYERLLLLYPKDLLLGRKLVENLIRLGQFDAATTRLDGLREAHPQQPAVYQQLVKLYLATGDDVQRQLAEADYHWLSGNQQRAVVLYSALLEGDGLDLISEQKLRQKVSDYKPKKDGISR